MAPSLRPGILHVTMQPHTSLEPAQFHDWYNNEHGPWRLRYPFFLNGFRYRATDLPGSKAASISRPSEVGLIDYSEPASTGSKELPEWMAIYDVTDMAEMLKESYTNLRTQPLQSQRELNTMKQIDVDRRFYDLISTDEGPTFEKFEKISLEGKGNVMVAVSIILHPRKEEELDKWYKKTYLPAIKDLSGWTRSRRFETATVDSRPTHEILFLHEFEVSSGLATIDQFESLTAQLRSPISSLLIQTQTRTYNLFYTFGPAPRELGALSTSSYDYKHSHIPHRMHTITASGSPTHLPTIASYVTTGDGTILPYTLTGSPHPSAPLIVLSNSILTLPGIWTDFLAEFFSKPENLKYRVLTYETRGRNSEFSKETAVTIDILVEDVVLILDALRVNKAKAIIGVSLGGVTALCAGLRYSERFEAFISCDTMSKSPDGADQEWEERIKVSEAEGAIDISSGEVIVGAELAGSTTRRWFAPESYDGGKMEEVVKSVYEMVKTNSLDGFRVGVKALWKYDLRGDIENINNRRKSDRVKGLFLVGVKDGNLPEVMKLMAASLEGTEFVVIDKAGHLPMVEKPKEVAEVLKEKAIKSRELVQQAV